MKRALTHLGVLGAPAPPPAGGDSGQLEVGGTVPPAGGGQAVVADTKLKRASAKLKSSRKLKVDRKGRVAVRVNCAGDAGAVCRGTVKLMRGKTSYGSKKFAVKAGKTATVKVKLRKKAKAALRKAGKKAVKSTVVITGADSSGRRINVRQAVRLR
jgi:hypothetical protein